MAFMDTLYSDEDEPVVTMVSVHSPVIQSSKSGAFYTSYAINIKSNNSCFTLQQSCVRRRYSEFVHLRDLLNIQHPIIDPPLLPPKNFFNRFNDSFVAQRAEGLEIFLKGVLNIPVYLSNKGVHLFLQSHFTMPQIKKLVTGDIPTPQLIVGNGHRPSLLEESCSSLPSTGSTESSNPSSISEQLGGLTLSQKHSSEELDSVPPLKMSYAGTESKPVNISTTIDQNILQTKCMPTRGSITSFTSEKSPSSASSSLDSERGVGRRVSFNEKVTIAVVQNQQWAYGFKSIKAGAC